MTSSYRFDLHSHHGRCGHADGVLREYIEAALALGLDAVGLSPHSPFFAEQADQFKPWVAMAKSDFAGYVREAIALRDEYAPRIQVLVGVESDFYAAHTSRYARIYEEFPLDFVIGSVHVLDDGIDIFSDRRWADRSEEALRSTRERYCELVALSARCGDFDVLGHVDALKAQCPEIEHVDTPAVDRMLDAIAQADVVIEVNTSGKTKPCGGWYPSADLLRRAFERGIKVTFGSDAHVPERVGDDLDAVRALLRDIGYTEWQMFHRRRRIALHL